MLQLSMPNASSIIQTYDTCIQVSLEIDLERLACTIVIGDLVPRAQIPSSTLPCPQGLNSSTGRAVTPEL